MELKQHQVADRAKSAGFIDGNLLMKFPKLSGRLLIGTSGIIGQGDPLPAFPGTHPISEDVHNLSEQLSKIVDFGAKVLYFYPYMKVVFINGKVSDL